MKEAGKHIIYSAKDIHAYLTGKLTQQEMHAMERAALTDPMLAEAMEGFHETPSLQSEKEFAHLQDQLNELKKKIANRKDTRANNWWKMAAVGLLLVGIAIALRMITTTPAKQKTIATAQPAVQIASPKGTFDSGNSINDVTLQTKQESEKPRVISGLLSTIEVRKFPASTQGTLDTLSFTSSATSDSTRFASSAATTLNTPTVNNLSYYAKPLADKKTDSQGFIAYNNDYKNKAINDNFDLLSRRSSGVKKKRAIVADSIDAFTLKEYNTSAEQTCSGKIIDEQNKPVPYANLIVDHHQTRTDENGFFDIAVNDSSTDLEIYANGYATKIATIATGDFQSIVLKKALLGKDTSGVGRSRSFTEILYKNGAEPKEGWTDYLQYLSDQLSYSTYDNGKPVTGDMIIEFKIDINGFPTSFNFEKSIDNDVDNAVMELITSGPKWRKTDRSMNPGTIRLKIIF